MIVVDASVWVSSLVTTEANHAASRVWLAHHLATGDSIVDPVLVLAEVGGTIARTIGQLGLGDAAVDWLLAMKQLRLVEIDHALGLRVSRLAVEGRLRGADAIYISVAQELGIPLVSWDKQQLARAALFVTAYSPDRAPRSN